MSRPKGIVSSLRALRVPAMSDVGEAALWIVGSLAALSVVFVIWFRFAPVGQTLTMTGRAWAGQEITRQWVPLDKISPRMVEAVIAAEDTKFCRHAGFDFGEVKAAIAEARAGKGLRGASTISQQTAKNVFLAGGGGFVRKGIEAWFTGLIELTWPKSRIMEVYLNVAEWGDGYFGVEAAAQGRFSKPASDVTKHEAALLASVMPNPAKWRVDPPGPYVRQRAGKVRARMDVVRRDGLAACAIAK